MEITSEMLSGITTALTSNLGVVLPVAIGLFATMTGIKIIPKVFKRFVG